MKARREASESNTNNKSLDITLLPVNSQYSQQANGYHESHGHPKNNLMIRQCNEVRADPSAMQSLGFHHSSDYCNGSNNYMLNSMSNDSHYPASCHDHVRKDATLEILNGYLQKGQYFGKSLGNNGAQNTVSIYFTIDQSLRIKSIFMHIYFSPTYYNPSFFGLRTSRYIQLQTVIKIT